MAKKTDVFYADRVTDGRFVTSAVKELMREMEGKQCEVCIRPRRNYTSNPQRRYYRGVCIRLLAMTMRESGIKHHVGRWTRWTLTFPTRTRPVTFG
jgi:hypothetical protein